MILFQLYVSILLMLICWPVSVPFSS